MEYLSTLPAPGTRKKHLYPKKDIDFINSPIMLKLLEQNYHSKSTEQLKRMIGCSTATLVKMIRKLGLTGKKWVTAIPRETVVMALEDYFGNGMMMQQIADKYGVSLSSVSAWVSKLLPVKNGETITLRSKV